MRIFVITNRSRFHKKYERIIAVFTDKEEAKAYIRQARVNSVYEYILRDHEVDKAWTRRPLNMMPFNVSQDWIGDDLKTYVTPTAWANYREDFAEPVLTKSWNDPTSQTSSKGNVKCMVVAMDEDEARVKGEAMIAEFRKVHASASVS